MTFAQRWRAWMIGLVAGAGMVATLMAVGIVLIIWKGTWSPAVEAARVDLLGNVAIGSLCLMGASMIGLLVAGPLAKLSAKLLGGEISVEGD